MCWYGSSIPSLIFSNFVCEFQSNFCHAGSLATLHCNTPLLHCCFPDELKHVKACHVRQSACSYYQGLDVLWSKYLNTKDLSPERTLWRYPCGLLWTDLTACHCVACSPFCIINGKCPESGQAGGESIYTRGLVGFGDTWSELRIIASVLF